MTSTEVVFTKRTEKGPDSLGLKGLNISDVHILNSKMPSTTILKGLYAIFDDEPLLASLDYICVVGDFFDTLVYNNHPELIPVNICLAYILRRCKQFDITIYWLKGTPRHDWEQMENIVALNNEIANIGARLFYFDQITVFYDDVLDLHLLFIPDEMNHDCSVTLDEVKELMEAKRISQVDISFMHGQFPHQLPPAARAPCHDPDEYQRITKYGVFIGHVHKHSKWGEIYAQGSFDRDTHGQEEDKGYLIHEIFTNGTHKVTFKVNPHSAIFKTLDVRGLNSEDTFDKINTFANAHPDGARLRIHADSGAAVFSQMAELTRKYPWIIWNKKVEAATKQVVPQISRGELNYEPVYINPTNVVSLLTPRLEKEIVDSSILAIAQVVLEEIIHVGHQ